MHSLETTEYNLNHCVELSRAQWVSNKLKRKVQFFVEDFNQTKEKYTSENLIQGIGDSYVMAFMNEYTQEFAALRR